MKHVIKELMRKIGRPFLEICENLENHRILKESYGDLWKSEEISTSAGVKVIWVVKFCRDEAGWVSKVVGDNAKPFSRRKITRVPRDREADVAKEVQAECEAYVKILRSRCQCDVGTSAELRYLGCQSLLELMRSRCREWRRTRTQTNGRQIETLGHMCFIYVCSDY